MVRRGPTAVPGPRPWCEEERPRRKAVIVVDYVLQVGCGVAVLAHAVRIATPQMVIDHGRYRQILGPTNAVIARIPGNDCEHPWDNSASRGREPLTFRASRHQLRRIAKQSCGWSCLALFRVAVPRANTRSAVPARPNRERLAICSAHAEAPLAWWEGRQRRGIAAVGKRLRDILETLCVLSNLLTDLRALVLLDITVSSGVLDITVSSGILDIMVSSGVLDIMVSSGERWSLEQFV